MSLWKRGNQYWADFMVGGKRYRKRLGTGNLQAAKRRERELLEAAGHGALAVSEKGPKRLSEATEAYLAAKRMRCSPRTLEFEQERLVFIKRHFGDVPLSTITAAKIAEYQRTRHEAGRANRTINMDVGVLSRLLKFSGRWRPLADHVHNLPENQGGIGRALTTEQRQRLFETAAANPEWEHVCCAAIVAANTSLRPVEVKHLRRCDVDLMKKVLYVRRSKNQTSHRVIPLNASASNALKRMVERADLLGHTETEHYLWPACQWGRFDPTKPMLKWDTAWRALREAAGLPGFRFHDLRHTIITELAEMGVADHVLESITGHLTRRMLEHYSHIRIDAKRQALDALDEQRKKDAPEPEKTENEPAIETVVEVDEALTSQSRHSLTLSGNPPHGKLLIPLERRDVRVVEGARLESAVCGSSADHATSRTIFNSKDLAYPALRQVIFSDDR